MGSRTCVSKLPLVQELLKAMGDMDSITPDVPWAPFPQATHKPAPFQASSSHPQHDHPNPPQYRAVTARMALPRRKGPGVVRGSPRLGGLQGAVVPLFVPFSMPLAIGSLGMCMAESLLSPLPAPTDPLCSRSIGPPALGRQRSVFRRGRTQR